jgi:hypothetical protein
MSNDGGKFLEISEYHGGSLRSCIRIPEGKHNNGWETFGGELKCFFMGVGRRREARVTTLNS